MTKRGTIPLNNSLVRKSLSSPYWNGRGGGGPAPPQGLSVVKNEGDEIVFSWPAQPDTSIYGYDLFLSDNCADVADVDAVIDSPGAFWVDSTMGTTISLNPMDQGLPPGMDFCFNVLYGDNPPYGSFDAVQVTIQPPPPLVVSDPTLFNYNELVDQPISGDTFLEIGYNVPATSNLGLQLTYTLYVSTSPNLDGTPAEIIANAEFSSSAMVRPQTILIGNINGAPGSEIQTNTNYWVTIIAEDTQGNRAAYEMLSLTTLTADTQPPTISDPVIIRPDSFKVENGIYIRFKEATDNRIPKSNLGYNVYYSDKSLQTLSEVDANGIEPTLQGNPIKRSGGIVQYIVNDLSIPSNFNVAVVVDDFRNRSLYNSIAINNYSEAEETLTVSANNLKSTSVKLLIGPPKAEHILAGQNCTYEYEITLGTQTKITNNSSVEFFGLSSNTLYNFSGIIRVMCDSGTSTYDLTTDGVNTIGQITTPF